MLDENEGYVDPALLSKAYNHQPFYKKFLIVAAGPITNLLVAFLLYWGIFTVGFTTVTPIIGQVAPNSIAASAGLTPGAEIISIDGHATHSWLQVIIRLSMRMGDQTQLSLVTQQQNSHNQINHQLILQNWQVNHLKPDPLSSLGITPYEPVILPIINKIHADTIAAQSPLKINDQVVMIDDQKISSWEDLIIAIQTHPVKKVIFTVKRDNQIKKFPVSIGVQKSFLQQVGFLGIEPPQVPLPANFFKHNKYSFIAAIVPAFKNVVLFSQLNFMVFGKLLMGKVSLQSLGGPISIFSSAGTALNYGIMPFLSLLAFLSIAIGVLNILPIPGLDGGHVLIQVIEWVRQKPLSIVTQAWLYRSGLAILLFLVGNAIVNDVLRLFN
jgi:regulator of sigma E protease